jgi:hypothetical protein
MVSTVISTVGVIQDSFRKLLATFAHILFNLPRSIFASNKCNFIGQIYLETSLEANAQLQRLGWLVNVRQNKSD